jgi:hypothetical protein
MDQSFSHREENPSERRRRVFNFSEEVEVNGEAIGVTVA